MEKSVKLQDFIKSVSDDILKSEKTGSFELLSPIDFEVSVSIKKEGKAGMDIVVVSAGGKYEREEVSKIRFSMGSPYSLEQTQKLVKIWQLSSSVSNENLDAMLRHFKELKK